MKLTPRQVDLTDHVDHSRDISGFNKWAQSSRTIGFLLLLLGWFTIPVEVFLRRDFGQRWFTAVNFYTGLFLLLIFATAQHLWHALWDKIQGYVLNLWSMINPYYTQPEPDDFLDGLMDASMLLVLTAYIIIGGYHLFKVWWRNRTDTALHSFDDGTSRFEWLAGLVMKIVNILAIPLVYLGVFLIPSRQRKSKPVPRLINDRSSFANTVVEPLLVFYLAMQVSGMLGLWLLFSAIALTIHANWKETAKKNKMLDFRDSMIEAKVMAELRHAMANPAVAKPVKLKKGQAQPAVSQAAVQVTELKPADTLYPDLTNIIEQMYTERSHLRN